MFKKRIRIAILFSVFLVMVLSVVLVNHEMNVYQNVEEQADKITQNIEREWQIYVGLADICYLREKSPLSIKKFINKIVSNVGLRGISNVYYWEQTHELCELDSFDRACNPHLANRVIDGEFTQVGTEDAMSFYQKQLLGIANIYPGFSLWYYLAKFLIVFGISGVPSLLAFLSSLFAVSFPITVPITAIVLVFFTMVQGYADDTTIVKLMTSSTGDENNLTLGMLHLADKTGC